MVRPADRLSLGVGGLAGQAGWRVARVQSGDPPDYYAVLEKAAS